MTDDEKSKIREPAYVAGVKSQARMMLLDCVHWDDPSDCDTQCTCGHSC